MRAGLDIGSTTIKCAVLDDDMNVIHTSYERHYSHILEKTREILMGLQETVGDNVILAISGSAGMGLADEAHVPFVQEVYAERICAGKLNPDTDCIIELGGEDAKILFLSNGMEVRMNGSCAGGTGAFIDQMAGLLKMQADEMDEAASKAKKIYTIASRCGVFAKSDIQPLINQGAETSDIAASIYQAVVNQTIAGLAQGRVIKGNVLYLGGPLTFSKTLRRCFDQTLKVNGTCPENSLYYVALGAAMYAQDTVCISDVLKRLEEYGAHSAYAALPPLFHNREEYWEFHNRHAKASVPRVPFDESIRRIHIGIDSGSTTIKIAVIDDEGNLLTTDYRSNDGNPLPIVQKFLIELYQKHPWVTIGSVTSTGYGEELMRKAFNCDYGLVETVAHFTAASHFMPDVDFIIDIGGQDMKCFRIENGMISDLFLNEACSSGCGSFLQTFAGALGYNTEEFARLGLFAEHPVDLGSRCTVFMNSSVKQAQKEGATIEAISAGLAVSVVKNALYKVIRCADAKQLGRHIVVQGGTFYNEAVLRAFEMEMGTEVIRPDIAGLMGAYGAALYGKKKAGASHVSSLMSLPQLESFERKTNSFTCQGCGNHCQLTVNTFPNGNKLISGNRCDKPVTGKSEDTDLNLYAYKQQKLLRYASMRQKGKPTIGIPLVLNMYELLPFWHTFWTVLGYDVVVSPLSSHALYEKGSSTIPSDTACYPAKMAHGHIEWLKEQNVDHIWYPCMSYNVDEHLGDNHYNCPIVAYYPESLKNNVEGLTEPYFLEPFIDLNDRNLLCTHLYQWFREHFEMIPKKRIAHALELAYQEYENHMHDIRSRGEYIINQARKQGKQIIVLAGRPYHVDPEINHGIDRIVTKYNAAVITEDAVSWHMSKFDTSVLNQWTYHSRLYAAARYCTTQPDMNLIQLVSFGCGLDAITTDETRSILQSGGRLYTQLKIDEITNPGAVNIRIRSLFAALEEREEAHA
ncbi:MAG: acyl-CoA dehydratase activase-related protein [Bulleidia sp.]